METVQYKSPAASFVQAYLGMIGLFLSYRFCFLGLFINKMSWDGFVNILLVGLHWDCIIVCCLLIPQSVILFVAVIFQRYSNQLLKISIGYFLFVFTLAFMISWFNLFYYHSLHTTINYTIWSWTNNWQFVAEMILEDSVLSWSITGVVLLFIIELIYLKRAMKQAYSIIQDRKHIIIFIIFLPYCIYAIGELFVFSQNTGFSQKREWNDASFNPFYTLASTTIRSYCFPNTYPVIDLTKITNKEKCKKTTQDVIPYNVVLIIMEGMQDSFTNDSILTPFLYQLKTQSLYFSNAYSSNFHTAHAIYSVLTGMPSQCNHPFFNTDSNYFRSSLLSSLKQKGYHTCFMMPHNDKFDNLKSFLKINEFDKIYSQRDYPSQYIMNTFGVSDDFLLSYSIPIIRHAAQYSPTFCTLLTVSNHVPFTIPDYFPNTGLERKYRIIQYADWALSQFFDKVRKEKWFSNTLFVLVGDHPREMYGTNFYGTSSHHVALYFYAPHIVKPGIENQLAGQVDILPTILGYINIPFIHNVYGEDLRKKRRDYLLVSSNNSIECISNNLYYEYTNQKNESFTFYNSDSLLFNDEQRICLRTKIKHYLLERLTNK